MSNTLTSNLSNATITGVVEVDLDETNDSVLVYGSSDAGTTKQAIHTDADGDVQVDILSSTLPTGAATSANQDLEITSLDTIATNTDITQGYCEQIRDYVDALPAALGETTMVNSLPVVVASNQTPFTVKATNTDGSEIGSVTSTTVTGSANGAGQYAVTAINVSAYKSISMQTSGTYSLVQTFECSNDNVNWASCPMQSVPLVPLAENTSVTGAGQSIYACNVNFKYFRNRISSYTSGTINTTLVLSTLPAALPTQPVQAAQDGTWTVQPGNTANTTPWLANPTTDYPSGATAITAASGNVANAAATATLAGTSGKTTYITGFEITSSGATVGSVVTVTVTGTITGTLSYTYAAPAGVLTFATPLIVSFPTPIPASATNTAIVVTLPALGAGNTNATTVAHGYTL